MSGNIDKMKRKAERQAVREQQLLAMEDAARRTAKDIFAEVSAASGDDDHAHGDYTSGASSASSSRRPSLVENSASNSPCRRDASRVIKADSARKFLWQDFDDDANTEDQERGGGKLSLFSTSMRISRKVHEPEKDRPAPVQSAVGLLRGIQERFGRGMNRNKENNLATDFSSFRSSSIAPRRDSWGKYGHDWGDLDEDDDENESNDGGGICARCAAAGSSTLDVLVQRKKTILLIGAAAAAIAVGAVFANSGIGIVRPKLHLSGHTATPTAGRFKDMTDILVKAEISFADTFDDASSPQYKALLWLAEEDDFKIDPKDEYMSQRFALAVFWYTMHDTAKEVDKAWDVSTDWLSSRGICAWYGITCHHNPDGNLAETSYDANNRVTSIQLPKNDMSGTLPRELFTALADLGSLNLKGNEGINGALPTEIGVAKELQYLQLDSCSLSGWIPSNVGDLGDLRSLSLYHNSLSGTIPSSIGKLVNLHSLYLDSNFLTGAIPSEMGTMKRVVDLRLRRNYLSGSIPTTFENLSELEILYFDANRLTGTFTSGLGSLEKLQELTLYKNKISGQLPDELGALGELEHLYIDHNFFTGTIPSSWASMKSLSHLFIYNNKLTGPIPEAIGGMPKLSKFQADENNLSGELPTSLGRLQNLYHLVLNNNIISGTLPTELGLLLKLDKLIMHGNAITGKVPDEVCELTKSHVLDELEMSCSGMNSERKGVQCDCCTKCH